LGMSGAVHIYGCRPPALSAMASAALRERAYEPG
jgi:hypothetical protein